MVVPFGAATIPNMFQQKNAQHVHVTGVLQGKDIFLSASKSQRTTAHYGIICNLMAVNKNIHTSSNRILVVASTGSIFVTLDFQAAFQTLK